MLFLRNLFQCVYELTIIIFLKKIFNNKIRIFFLILWYILYTNIINKLFSKSGNKKNIQFNKITSKTIYKYNKISK